MKDTYHFGGIGVVCKVLWGAPIMEVREVDDDARSGAAGDDQFVAGADDAAQADERMRRGAVGAFGSTGLRLSQMTFVVGKVGEGQARLI